MTDKPKTYDEISPYDYQTYSAFKAAKERARAEERQDDR